MILTPFLYVNLSISAQVEDVARAFEIILHRGEIGKIYNIGGSNEKSNIEVARDLIRLTGHGEREGQLIKYVEDRAFNDLRYTINSDLLRSLGWKEEVG